MPDWGVGKVLSAEGEVVSILFSATGEKKLDLRFVALEITEDIPPAEVSSGRLAVRGDLNIERLESGL